MDIDVLESWGCGLGLPEDSIYVGLKNASHIFRDDLFVDSYSSIGRGSKSPSLLLKATILQFFHNVSDRQAEACSKYDLRWKYVLGGEIGKAEFDHSTLSKFRTRILINKKERTIFDEILTKAIDDGFIPNKCAKQIIDSTYMHGAGAVQDTYTLIRKAIMKVSKTLKGRLDFRGLNLDLDYEINKKPDIDWNNADERENLLNVLYNDSLKITTAALEIELSVTEKASLELLISVTNQDIEKYDEANSIQNAYALINKAIHKLSKVLKGRLDINSLNLSLGYSNKGMPEIDWDNADDRWKTLNDLRNDSLMITLAAQGLELSETEKKILEPLIGIANQETHDKDGTVKIKIGVAKDRIISVTDPEMRHARKSSSNLFDGNKAHVSIETEKGFIANIDVTAGNIHDSAACTTIIDDQPEDRRPTAVTGDCAYGTGDNREKMEIRNIKLISPVPDMPGYKGCFPKSMFGIDLDNQTCCCPAGQFAPDKVFNRETGELEVFLFSQEQCHNCPFQDKCTKNKKGRRTVTVNKHERLLQEGRAFQQTEEYQQEYQQRYRIEAKNAELVRYGIRQARYIGLAKARLQALFVGTLLNFKLYWKLVIEDQRRVLANGTKTPLPDIT